MQNVSTVLERHGVATSSLRPMEGAEDEIYLLTVLGKEAVPQWRRLRALVDQTGRWPVILGGDEDLDLHVENLELYEDPSADPGSGVGKILRDAERTDPVSWVQQQNRGGLESITGEWSADAARPGAASDEELRIPGGGGTLRPPLPSVHVALVPTRWCWEAPAYLRFGGFNACPQPHEHVALWRRWHHLYGAELVGISHDEVEAMVGQPPADREGAMRLAREQYAYCSDIVTQGLGTVSELAAGLVGRTAWYFWWD